MLKITKPLWVLQPTECTTPFVLEKLPKKQLFKKENVSKSVISTKRGELVEHWHTSKTDKRNTRSG